MTHSRLNNLLHVIRNTVSQEFKLDGNPKRQAIIDDLCRVYENHPCICISHGVCDDLRKVFGNHLTTKTIYNAFDQPLIAQMAQEHIDLQQYGLEKGRYLIHLGSFKPQKAHDVLLTAYAQSHQQYPLVLVGQGKGFDDTQALAKTLGISDKVKFLGFHKNPYVLLKHARAMVLFSRFEGFGRVISEALALDVPVLSTDCPSGPGELLPSSNLVPVDDIPALARAIDDCSAAPEKYVVPFDKQFLPKNIAQQYIDYLSKKNYPKQLAESDINITQRYGSDH